MGLNDDLRDSQDCSCAVHHRVDRWHGVCALLPATGGRSAGGAGAAAAHARHPRALLPSRASGLTADSGQRRVDAGSCGQAGGAVGGQFRDAAGLDRHGGARCRDGGDLHAHPLRALQEARPGCGSVRVGRRWGGPGADSHLGLDQPRPGRPGAARDADALDDLSLDSAEHFPAS